MNFSCPNTRSKKYDVIGGKFSIIHSRLQPLDLDLLLNVLLESLAAIPKDRLLPHMKTAEALIGAIDPDDVPFVALALAEESHGIWSNDQAFDHRPGIKRWTTAGIKQYLRDR